MPAAVGMPVVMTNGVVYAACRCNVFAVVGASDNKANGWCDVIQI